MIQSAKNQIMFNLNFKIMTKKEMLLTSVATIAILTGCNVTRTVTTTSSFVQKGDTTTQITTKTIESYDATKKGL